jgi:anthranilate 1,2-dioxygenase small subunit
MSGSETGRELRARLRDFYDDYAHCLDDGDLDRWAQFFTEDGTYRVIARENRDRGLEHATIYCKGKGMILDRALAVQKTTVQVPRSLRHLVGGVRIRSAGEVIRSEASFIICESLSDRDPRLFLVGRHVDQVVREGDGFLFKERDCVYDNYRILNSLIFPA